MPQVEGELHGRAKLTRRDVVRLRQAAREGASLRDLLAGVRVSQTAVWNAVTGMTWTCVNDVEPPAQFVGKAA